MRTMVLVLVLVIGAIAAPSGALAAEYAAPPAAQQSPLEVTMRLGISAGDAIRNIDRGTNRRALERIVPELFDAATMLGIRIDAVSVGRGFWSDDGVVESENDLDLIVSGVRENILAFAATLGQRWDQSVVLAWQMQQGGDMLTATLPLISGTDALDEELFEALAKELADGGHIKYAGAQSNLFVAHTADDSTDDFRARMAKARAVLTTGGIQTGTLAFGQAEMIALTRDTYQQFVDGAVRGKTVAAGPAQTRLAAA